MTTSKTNGTNETALITGASRGIGRATALRIAQRGAFTILHCGRDTAGATDVLREIERAGGQGAVITVDLERSGAAAQLSAQIERLLAEQGRAGLDVVVSNAGVGLIERLEETSEASFDRVFAINVKAPFFLMQALAPKLSDGARIVHITSFVTRVAMPVVGAYSMTKGAIDTMTRWLAKELAPRGIRVNAVSPGVIDTDMNAASLASPEGRRAMGSLSVFDRVGEPSDVADVVAFLASRDARWITGQSIEVSGGSFLG